MTALSGLRDRMDERMPGKGDVVAHVKAKGGKLSRHTCKLCCLQQPLEWAVSEDRFRIAVHAVAGVVYDWDLNSGSAFRSHGLKESFPNHQ
jgi:hypothetical protein